MKLLVMTCCLFFLCFGETASAKNNNSDELSQDNVSASASNTPENILKAATIDFTTIEWEALIPESDLEAILNPPDYITQVADGSLADQIENSIQSAMQPKQMSDEVYEQALKSTNIIDTMNGKNVRIPGFIVPVEFIGEKQVSTFFLVPYFGACLHMPPPPPNQIIYIETEKGITLESLYEPVWISGKLSTELFEDEVATSAYTMKMATLEPYDLTE